MSGADLAQTTSSEETSSDEDRELDGEERRDELFYLEGCPRPRDHSNDSGVGVIDQLSQGCSEGVLGAGAHEEGKGA